MRGLNVNINRRKMVSDKVLPGRIQEIMKKTKRDELHPGYRRTDLGKGVRGKYLKAYRAGKRNLGKELLQSVREMKAGQRARVHDEREMTRLVLLV